MKRLVHTVTALAAATIALATSAPSQTVVNIIDATSGAWGLDYHDGFLWQGDDSDGFIYKLDPADGTVLDVLPSPYDENHISFGANHGVTWDGSSFWVAGDFGKDWIYELDAAGATLDSIPSPTDAVGGLSWDGTNLLVSRYYPNDQADVLVVDPADGTILNTIPSPGLQPFGIAYDGSDGTIWNGMDDIDGDPENIWNLTYPGGAVLSDFASPGGGPKGIAIGGGYMWLVANATSGGGRRIYQIDLAGAGTPDITAIPTSFDFGIVALGSPASYSQTLRNDGDGDLTISDVVVGGAFSRDAISFPVVLSPGGTLMFDVTFDPPGAGSFAVNMTVESDDIDEGSLVIPLEGTGVFADATINVAGLPVFDDTGVGLVEGRILTIENVGFQDLTVTDIASDDPAFTALHDALPITLSTFESFDATIVFAPTEEIAYGGTISIQSDDPSTPTETLAASGTGVLRTYAGGDVIWSAQGIENVVTTLPIADITGDGIPDLVSESYDAGASGDPHVAYYGNSDGVGVSAWAVGAGASGGYGDDCLATIADLDGDTFPEIVRGVAWGGQRVEVRGSEDGALLWSYATSVHGGGWVYSVDVLEDVSGDGLPEVLAGAGTDGSGGGSRRIYGLDGATGALRFAYITGDAVQSVTSIGDVSGDGVQDVVGASSDEFVYCLSGASTGFATVLWSFDTGGTAYFVDEIEDVSGDGLPDVIAGSWSSRVFCLSGASGGVEWEHITGWPVLESRTIPDVTGDGVQDVVACGFGPNFRVLDGATGALHWSYTTGENNWSVDWMPDVTGDGVPEVIAGSQDQKAYCIDGASGERVWDTDDHLDATVLTVRAIGDVNGNGTPDVVAGTQYLTAGGGKTWCLDGGAGVIAVDDPTVDDPTSVPAVSTVRFAGVSPNPLRDGPAAFVFDVTGSGAVPVSVDVFDAGGRRIATMAEAASAGTNRVLWDGRTSAGDRVTPGVYFYRVTARNVTGESHTHGKLQILR